MSKKIYLQAVRQETNSFAVAIGVRDNDHFVSSLQHALGQKVHVRLHTSRIGAEKVRDEPEIRKKNIYVYVKYKITRNSSILYYYRKDIRHT